MDRLLNLLFERSNFYNSGKWSKQNVYVSEKYLWDYF